jgi:DNA polymerase-3 subunit gamma/tau
MTLIKLLQTRPALPIDVLIDKLDALRQEVSPAGKALQTAANHQSIEPEAPSLSSLPGEKPEGTEAENEDSSPADESADNPDKMWQRICEVLSKENPSLAANLAKCSLKQSAAGSLEIDVPGNGFTLNMIQREKNMTVLQQVCTAVLGDKQNIQLSVSDTMDDRNNKKKKNNQLKQKALDHPLVADAIEIFDGKLVDVKVL